nr:hypothetical protein [uncultured Fretibacterium sp.]
MTKRLRQFKVASVLFVLALAAITVIMFAGKPASAALPILDTNFFIEYTASTLESGALSTKGGDDLTVKGFSEMFLGAKVDVVGTRQDGASKKKPNKIQKDSSAGLDYRVGVPNNKGAFGFSAGTKPGDTGKLVLKMEHGGTSSKFTFEITAKDPVSVDLSKAALAIDTSKRSEDTLTLTLKGKAGAVDKDLKIAGVTFDFDPAKLDAAKLSLTWDGAANNIQAKVLDAAYSVKDVPVKAKVDVTFTGVDGQNWPLSEVVNFTVTSGKASGGGGSGGGGGCNAGYAFLALMGLLPLASRMKKR